ncbi:TonB-dependent receptor [Ulvibacter antarcticus]|uniref:TonB dependent receptor n=1 Tax=Ulvibacter antarcticus TaxID=442714 RepID=A0A3L9Y8M6_9FLAO|nr:TonB-dependent receptor [Ulvibacter antarcticus]RMA56724.1 hypothetical protein BXY75_3237 [Ulvibacter antarcticus]
MYKFLSVRTKNNRIASNAFQSRAYLQYAFIFGMLLFSFSLSAQEGDDLGTEVVNIVKPYTPTISDAFKVKETPALNDSITTVKKDVQYSIFSVPVASTFTPAKGKAATVEKTKPIKLYDNYASLGFGNYTSILGELYSNFEISRTDNAGFFFKHNSSQGGVDGIRLEDKFYDTSLDANYTSRQKDASYRLDVGLEHQLYNWYGLNENYNTLTDETLATIDPQQSYLSGNLGGSIAVDDSFFEKVSAKLRYLSDSFSSSEFNATLAPEFSFPITDVLVNLDADINYLSGSFDKGYLRNVPIKYNLLNAGIIPSVTYVNNDLTLGLGVAAYLGLDSENSETNFYLYPRVNVSYRLVDELLIVYGGVEGNLQQNTFYDFKEANPFVSPSLQVMPTNTLYDAFGGLKGKLSNSIGYNLRASFINDDNKALFRLNEYRGIQTEAEGYEQGNSFKVVYDDVKTLSLFGELKVEVSNSFSLGVSGTFNSYTNEFQPQAWNLPEIEASVFTNFNITEKLYGGASLFYVGERKDLFVQNIATTTSTSTEITLDGYVDANLHLGYRINDRFAVFVKGSNLLSDSYEKWAYYKVLGIQALAGATYKFDW